LPSPVEVSSLAVNFQRIMSGPTSNFPAFLYANWSNTPYAFLPLPQPVSLPVHHHHQLKQYHLPSRRTMENDLERVEVEGGSPRAAISNNNVNTSEIGNPSVATGVPPVASFEDIFRADAYSMSQWRDFNTNQPEMACRATDQARADPLMPRDNITGSYDVPYTSFTQRSSFASSSLSSVMSSTDNSSSIQPFKIDSSPRLTTLVGLPDRVVDVSQFDNITDDVWPFEVTHLPSLDDINSSPSSSHGPYTPTEIDEGSYPGLDGSDIHTDQAITKVDTGGLHHLGYPGAHPHHYLPSTMHHTALSQQSLSTWPTMIGPEYAASTLPGMHAFTQHGLQFSHPHTTRVPSMPDTGSLQELEVQDPATAADTSDESEEDSESNLDVNDVAIHEATHRRERDRYLINRRREGFSYREIKRMGKFREAESTLRGRVRVLTKDKSERVRRPEWNQNDVSLEHLASYIHL
jgi:hypothetical protein